MPKAGTIATEEIAGGSDSVSIAGIRDLAGLDNITYSRHRVIMKVNALSRKGACPPKASLRKRPLMSCEQASEVESLFSILANDTRLRVLHEIARQAEVGVTAIAKALDMKPQAISNQLLRLSDRGIVVARRVGSRVLYRIQDQRFLTLLERGLCIVEESAQRLRQVSS